MYVVIVAYCYCAILKKSVSHTTELCFVWKDQRPHFSFSFFLFFVFAFCFALLYIIYKDLYIYFTFALRFTCAMRNVPAGTSRLRKTLTMPDRQALLREAQTINPCVIDVGTRYRDWLWHCFFSDSIKPSAKKPNVQTAGTRRRTTTLTAIPLFKH